MKTVTVIEGMNEPRSADVACFPVTYSLLSEEALLQEVAHAYRIDRPRTCQLMRSGLNDSYEVTTATGSYMARIYRAGWRSESEIAYELELLTHLANKGVPVSTPIPDSDGQQMRPLHAPEGARQLVLFTYAPGESLRWKDEAQCYEAGKLLAAIHAGAEDFVSTHSRFELDLGCLIEKPLAEVRPYLEDLEDDWRYLEQFATRLRARVERAIENGLDWGICHGDFGGGNIHMAPDGSLMVFDFDICGPGWRAYDLATIKLATTQWLELRRTASPHWEGFLQGYRSARSLAEANVIAVPLFYALRHLWGMGLQAGNVRKWGTKFMNRWYFGRRLKFFRSWEAEYEASQNGRIG